MAGIPDLILTHARQKILDALKTADLSMYGQGFIHGEFSGVWQDRRDPNRIYWDQVWFEKDGSRTRRRVCVVLSFHIDPLSGEES